MTEQSETSSHIPGKSEAGDAESLFPLVYKQLRALAGQHMRQERAGHTLQATALVHEAYLRILNANQQPWQSAGQFYVAAAEAMRRILIEHARKRARLKRGGDRRRLPISVLDLAAEQNPEEILALDEAIRRFEDVDAQAAAVMRLRFYAGLSVEQTAEAMGLSPRTVKREWAYARAWLYRRLRDSDTTGAD